MQEEQRVDPQEALFREQASKGSERIVGDPNEIGLCNHAVTREARHDGLINDYIAKCAKK